MSSILILVLLSSVIYIKCIDAEVVILDPGGNDNQTVCECGRSLTLTCKFYENATTIVWKNENNVLPIAICRQNNCTIHPSYNKQYNISFDKRWCVFNLTVIKVTMKDNGRKLVCSDGSHTDYKIISVRDYNLDVIEDRNFGKITVTSGCVSQDTKVSFIWMQKDVCSSIEKQLTPEVLRKNTTSCSNDSVCGNDQLIKYIEELSSNLTKIRNHQLRIIVVYEKESKVSDEIVVKYIIHKGEIRSCLLLDNYVLCIATGVAVWIILLLIAFIKKHYTKAKYKAGSPYARSEKQPINQRNTPHDKLKTLTTYKTGVEEEKEEDEEEEEEEEEEDEEEEEEEEENSV